MTRRSTKPRLSTRSIVIKPESTYERDLFLEIGMEYTEDVDVYLDTAMGRIELEIRGTQDDVNTVITKLSDLEHQISMALYPDRDGYYLYHNQILTKMCKPPVNLDLFSSSISAFGFDTKIQESSLYSEAPVEDLTSIHRKVVDLRQMILGEFNRDIERFFIMIALTTNTDQMDLIIDTAIELEVIQETEYGYQFTMEIDEAKDRLLEQMGIELHSAMTIDEQEFNDISLADLGLDGGFEGGKIVFMKDGEEVDAPEFDDTAD